MLVNDDFIPKRVGDKRLPPGQYEVNDFPVLSLGPTPRVSEENWSLEIKGLAENLKWNWGEFAKLPRVEMTTDIHCVTKWSKLGTKWSGVSLDYLMALAKVKLEAKFIIAYSSDGYSTNLPLADVTGGQAMVATEFNGREIPAEHGGPARLFVPHLYFWKSAKWLAALEFAEKDAPGFWEVRGYHNYGDPWKEERYTND